MFPINSNYNTRNECIGSTISAGITFEPHTKKSMLIKYHFIDLFLKNFRSLYGENINILFFGGNSEKYDLFSIFQFQSTQSFCESLKLIDK